MAITDSRVTIHMAASLDGFIARKDGSVDWLETADEFADGETMDPDAFGSGSQTTCVIRLCPS
jgi:riboflavin biosynthesis pyrimidine reductase